MVSRLANAVERTADVAGACKVLGPISSTVELIGLVAANCLVIEECIEFNVSAARAIQRIIACVVLEKRTDAHGSDVFRKLVPIGERVEIADSVTLLNVKKTG